VTSRETSSLGQPIGTADGNSGEPGGGGERRRYVRPYGDTTGDGMVQVSFTLPLPHGPRAEAAAKQLAGKMGFDPAMVAHSHAIGPDFTFFVVYGSATHMVDLDAIRITGREYPLLTPPEVNSSVKKLLQRKLVVVGACIGTDAHTVGIDAILSLKGFAGEKGLEYYRELKVVNLGAQVPVSELVARARAEKADAVLVSQVVTQRDAHISNAREMATTFRESMGQRCPVLVVGGPRFDPLMASQLGVDRVFGRGTTPGEVASFLVHAMRRSADAAENPAEVRVSSEAAENPAEVRVPAEAAENPGRRPDELAEQA
jgi:beta-lysine 5,6-aminomutase beta subunit